MLLPSKYVHTNTYTLTHSHILPDGISTEAIGFVIFFRSARTVSKGGRADPLKLNPKIASTTTKYCESISARGGRLERNVMFSFSHWDTRI